MGRREPRPRCPEAKRAHRRWWARTNLTRRAWALSQGLPQAGGVKVQVQQTGLLRERPRGLKLGSSGREEGS